MINKDIKDLCSLDKRLYQCISDNIDTDQVVLTDKQILHIADKHPDAYNDVLMELNATIACPDYIIKDEKHNHTDLVVRKISSEKEPNEHTFIVLRICTDSHHGKFANSVISGWKISDKRLQSYLRNKVVLYKKE